MNLLSICELADNTEKHKSGKSGTTASEARESRLYINAKGKNGSMATSASLTLPRLRLPLRHRQLQCLLK